MKFPNIVQALLASLLLTSCATNKPLAVYRLDCSIHQVEGPMSITHIRHDVYASLPALKAAVSRLPAGSRLVWDTGCIGFTEIPMGTAPRMRIPEFKKYCRNHRIKFEYSCGLPPESLYTKTFNVSNKPVPGQSNQITFDAKVWLEKEGVLFPPGGFARWQPRKKRLIVRSSEEQLDFVLSILQAGESNSPPSDARLR